MLLGLLSDTHDRIEAAAAGVAALKTAGAEYLLHCGDVGGEGILDQLTGLPAGFVWGNNDWDQVTLQRYAADLGIQCFGALGELQLGGKAIAIAHGDDGRAVRRILDGQEHDYLFVGHSHVKADQRVGRVRIVNPGALYRAREKTVATLDTGTDVLRFITISV
ncbi:MAG TPA: metallophosphoesterase family protein [Tepidisphaeraceae bacterium]|nr:metallophosphoesterase family protein [Tepidisphaeraceae bacterium]